MNARLARRLFVLAILSPLCTLAVSAQTVEPTSPLLQLTTLGGPPVLPEQGDLVYDVAGDRFVLAAGRVLLNQGTIRLREIPVAGTSFPAELEVGPGFFPALAPDPSTGGFVLAFGAEQRFFARALDAAFQAVRTDELFTGLPKELHVVEDAGTGEFLVAASRNGSQVFLGQGIEARRFSPSTGALGASVLVATEPAQPFSVGFDPVAGEYLLGRLQIPGAPGLFPDNYRIARVSRAGTLDAPVLVGPQDPGANRIAVVHDPRRGRNLAVFVQVDASEAAHLWGQWFAGDGTLLGAAFEFFQPQGKVSAADLDVAALYSPLSDAFAVVLLKTSPNGSQRLVTLLLHPDGTAGASRSTPLGATVIADLRAALRPADDSMLVSLPGSGELVGMRFAITGSAPPLALVGCGTSSASLQASGLTPNGLVALLWSNELGAFALPPSICNGLILQLGSPRLGKLVRADATGSIDVPLPASACGVLIQALDLAGCQATNVVP